MTQFYAKVYLCITVKFQVTVATLWNTPMHQSMQFHMDQRHLVVKIALGMFIQKGISN